MTGIAATARGEVVFEGREGHAGTTPMAASDDALVAAAELVLRLRDTAAGLDGAVATVGRIEVAPGATNVIPGRAVLSVDLRAPDDERVEALTALVPAELSRGRRDRAVARAEQRAAGELEALGAEPLEIASGAGHDAGVLAAAGVPTGCCSSAA